MSYRTRRNSVRKVAAFVALASTASLLAFSSPSGAAQVVASSRISGADRYATAANLSLAAYTATGSNSFVLVNGENFPDGLSSAGLAGFVNAPILLTKTATLPLSTLAAIATLDGIMAGPATIHIVGGLSAVSQAVRDQLTALGYTLNALQGADRYATAIAAATYAKTLQPLGLYDAGTGAGVKRTAIVVSGESFPDALAAGSPAFRGKFPILLTKTAALPASVSTALTAIGAQQVLIVGGESAVSAAVATQISALGMIVKRVSGADRYATAAALAALEVAPPAPAATFGMGFYTPGLLGLTNTDPNFDEALLASGEGFADAMASAPYAGALSDPILLTKQCEVPASTTTFLTANIADIQSVVAVGGAAAICDAALLAAKASATQVTPTAVITALEGGTSFKVVFSESMSALSVSPLDFSIDRVVNPDPTIGALPVTVTTFPDLTLAGTFKTMIVPVAATGTPPELRPGDVVTLFGNALAGVDTSVLPGFRRAAGTTLTVIADVIRPTVAILAPQGGVAGTVAGDGTAYVTFSEAVVNSTVLTNYSLTRGAVVTLPTSVTPFGPNTFQVTFGGNPLQIGDRIDVLNALPSRIADNALPIPNQIVPNFAIVVQDITAPTIVKAVLGINVQNTAAILDILIPSSGADVRLSSRATGTAFGLNGNGWTVFLGPPVPPEVAGIAINSATRTIRMTVQGLDATGFATAWANSAAGALFSATVIAPGAMTTVSAGLSSGGTTGIGVALLFNESVQGIGTLPADLNDFQICSDATVFATCSKLAIGAASLPIDLDGLAGAVAMDGFPVPGTNGTGIASNPVTGTAVIKSVAGSGVSPFVVGYADLSGNPNAAQVIVTSL